jgi:hypothetical protein
MTMAVGSVPVTICPGDFAPPPTACWPGGQSTVIDCPLLLATVVVVVTSEVLPRNILLAFCLVRKVAAPR